jgi:hypothetical protein
MKDFQFLLTITAETREAADAVLRERIGYDEEVEGVGDYTIDATAVDELVADGAARVDMHGNVVLYQHKGDHHGNH